MQRLVRFGGLFLLLLALIVPSFAGEQKADDKKKADDEKKEEKKNEPKEKKLTWADKQRGKLTQLDAEGGRNFTVQIQTKIPDQGAFDRLAQLQGQLVQLQGRKPRNAQEANSLRQQIATKQKEIFQQQQKLYKDGNFDLKLRAADAMKVRVTIPPLEYDDKGNPKKYTEKDLKALKGSGGLPGYPAELDALRTGQLVEVYLAKKLTAAPPPVKGKKGEDEFGPLNRPEVVLIVIQGEGAQK